MTDGPDRSVRRSNCPCRRPGAPWVPTAATAARRAVRLGHRCSTALLDRTVECLARDAARRAPTVAASAIDIERETRSAWFQHSDRSATSPTPSASAARCTGSPSGSTTSANCTSTYLHLMKVLRAREGANDGGYAVVDYRDVDPALGTRADLESLADELHERGISLCLDVVMNHTAREHPWAQRARAGSAAASRLLPRVPRPHRARPLRGARCPRCSPRSRPATSRGTTTCRGGCGRRSTPTSGT